MCQYITKTIPTFKYYLRLFAKYFRWLVCTGDQENMANSRPYIILEKSHSLVKAILNAAMFLSTV